MKIKSFLSNKELPICVFLLFGFLSVLYNGFDDAALLGIKIFFAVCVAVFAFFCISNKQENDMLFPFGIFIVSVVSVNVFPQSENLHFIAGAAFAVLSFALVPSKRLYWFSIAAMLAAVILDPSEAFITLPALIFVLIALGKKLAGICNLIVCAVFLTGGSLFGNLGFRSEQFNYLRLSFGLLNSQKEILLRFAVISIPVFVLAIWFIVRLFRQKVIVAPLIIIAEFFLTLFAFLISDNHAIITLFFLPFFAIIFSLAEKEGIKNLITDFGQKCQKHLLLYLLMLAYFLSMPLLLQSYANGNPFFDAVTYIIYRQI